MADRTLLKLLKQGSDVWNAWRQEHKREELDLTGVDLFKKDLNHIDLSRTILNDAVLSEANLTGADFSNAEIRGAYFDSAELSFANFSFCHLVNSRFENAYLVECNLAHARCQYCSFSEANLSYSDLRSGNFSGADLYGCSLLRSDLENANLTGANLQYVSLVEANVEQAILTGCSIYGISAWELKGQPKDQTSLILTPMRFGKRSFASKSELERQKKTEIVVDNLAIAQFLYLLLNRSNLRSVLDTITSKAVLILGRFTPERKAILDTLAEEVRSHNLIPIIFDFEKPMSRDFTETIKTLASISLFIIADITSPKSSPLELQATVPDYQIPFVLILQEGEEPFSMLNDLSGKYDWVLKPVIKYSTGESLRRGFKEAILNRAWSKHHELQKKKAEVISTISIEDFLKT